MYDAESPACPELLVLLFFCHLYILVVWAHFKLYFNPLEYSTGYNYPNMPIPPSTSTTAPFI